MRRLAFALALLLAAPALPAVTLTILHTSDLHGRVHPHDALADEDLGEGLARVATAVKAIRAEGNATVLLDSGDTIQGSPDQALAFAGPGRRRRSDRARDEPRRLRRDGHRQPRVRLRPRAPRGVAQAGALSLSLRQRDGRETALRPLRSMPSSRTAGVRVGVLGFVTPNVPNWESPATDRGAAVRRRGRGRPAARPGPARPAALRPRRGADAPGLRARPGDRRGAGRSRREPGLRPRDRGARSRLRARGPRPCGGRPAADRQDVGFGAGALGQHADALTT